MEEMSGFLYFFIIVIMLIFIACYAAIAIFLSRFSKKYMVNHPLWHGYQSQMSIY